MAPHRLAVAALVALVALSGTGFGSAAAAAISDDLASTMRWDRPITVTVEVEGHGTDPCPGLSKLVGWTGSDPAPSFTVTTVSQNGTSTRVARWHFEHTATFSRPVLDAYLEKLATACPQPPASSVSWTLKQNLPGSSSGSPGPKLFQRWQAL
jgi:hypothetical protein